MGLFDTLKDAASSVGKWTEQAAKDATDWTEQAAKDASDWTEQAAKDTADWTEQAAKDVGSAVECAVSYVADSATTFAAELITNLLKSVNLDTILSATKTYHEKTGNDISATENFLYKLKDIQKADTDNNPVRTENQSNNTTEEKKPSNDFFGNLMKNIQEKNNKYGK